MGISERKEREKELKKSIMLEAAEALILEKGLDNLNMNEVADRAEVSKGSLYQYFDSKTDLVLGICNKATTLLSKEIKKVLTQDRPGIELVHMIGATFMTFVSEHPEYFRAMRFHDNLKETSNLEDSNFLSSCSNNMHESFTCMVRAIQIGMQDGSINPSYDPKELALILWATSHGMVNMAYQHQNTQHFSLLNELGIDLRSLFENFMKMIGCGIATDVKKKNYDSQSFFETKGTD
jgi:AcrR family transcriptional regulator